MHKLRLSVAVTLAIVGTAIGNLSLSAIAMINVLAGALIGVPLLIVSNVQLSRARRLVSNAVSHSALEQGSRKELSSTPTAELPSHPASITEHTTLHLKKPGVDKNPITN